jgi:hypothetical protein
MTYEELAAKLREHRFERTKISAAHELNREPSRRTLSIALMKAIGCETVNIGDV